MKKNSLIMLLFFFSCGFTPSEEDFVLKQEKESKEYKWSIQSHHSFSDCQEDHNSMWIVEKEFDNKFDFYLQNRCMMKPPYGKFEIVDSLNSLLIIGQIRENGMCFDLISEFSCTWPNRNHSFFDSLYSNFTNQNQQYYSERHLGNLKSGNYNLIKTSPTSITIKDGQLKSQVNLEFSDTIHEIHPEDHIGIVFAKPIDNLNSNYCMIVLDKDSSHWYIKKRYQDDLVDLKKVDLSVSDVNKITVWE